MDGTLILALWLVSTQTTVAGATGGGPCAYEPSTCDAAAVAEFTARVEEYLLLRNTAIRDLPVDRPFEDAGEMLAARDAVRRAIRDARPEARAGDLFTARASAAFRLVISATAAAHGLDPKDIVRALRGERHPHARRPAVNTAYDWRLGAWMWPALLHALPPLPADLQYRLVDDDLVLIDLRASLVVDILEDAMDTDDD